MTSKYASCDMRWEKEFDATFQFYLETHPLARVVLDLRGQQVHSSWSDGAHAAQFSNFPAALASPPVKPLIFLSPAKSELASSARVRLLSVIITPRMASIVHGREGFSRILSQRCGVSGRD